MPDYPAGPITFLLTDVENSTRITRALGSHAYRQQLKQPHDEILRAAIAQHDGHSFSDTGDGFFVAFQHAHQGLACAVAIQQALATAALTAEDRQGNTWPLRVRTGLHTAVEEVLPDADGNYHHGE